MKGGGITFFLCLVRGKVKLSSETQTNESHGKINNPQPNNPNPTTNNQHPNQQSTNPNQQPNIIKQSLSCTVSSPLTLHPSLGFFSFDHVPKKPESLICWIYAPSPASFLSHCEFTSSSIFPCSSLFPFSDSLSPC